MTYINQLNIFIGQMDWQHDDYGVLRPCAFQQVAIL